MTKEYLIIFNKNYIYKFKGTKEQAREVAEALRQALHYNNYEIKEVDNNG